ncbi:hypothetical protein KCV07_g3351, partial [Aureobasidium melanogenum]
MPKESVGLGQIRFNDQAGCPSFLDLYSFSIAAHSAYSLTISLHNHLDLPFRTLPLLYNNNCFASQQLLLRSTTKQHNVEINEINMDLRQYLIAPHEQVQNRPSHHHTLVYTDSQHQPQPQQQPQQHRQQFRSHPQHHLQQQSQQHQPQHQQPLPQHRSLNTTNPEVHITRDQVLKGLSLYPDIIASVLLSKTHGDGNVAAHSPNQDRTQRQSQGQRGYEDRGFKYQNSHRMLGSDKMDSCYPFAGQEQRMQRRSDKRSNIDNAKPMSSAKPTDKEPTTAATTPTSPRAGRYAKGQRLQQRQQRCSPQDSHVQRQGRGHLSSTTVAAGSIPTPALSKTPKRKASKAGGVSWAGDILITDADASSFPNKKNARKSRITDEEQEVIDGAFEQFGKRSNPSSTFAPRSLQASDTGSTQDTTNRATEPKPLTTPTDLVVGKHHVAAAHKTTKSAKNKAVKAAAAHDNLLTTTTTPLPCSFQFYTTSIPSKPQHCVKASQHSKIHATCFAWYHVFCPFGNKNVGKDNSKRESGDKDNNGNKKKQKGKNKCKYLHALTEPPSYVQPPRGYVHGKEDKHDNSNNEAEVEEIKPEDSNMKKEDTLLANTAQLTQDTKLGSTTPAQCTLDWCPGDWLWDHDYDDNHGRNHSSPEEEILDSADLIDSTVKISKNH